MAVHPPTNAPTPPPTLNPVLSLLQLSHLLAVIRHIHHSLHRSVPFPIQSLAVYQKWQQHSLCYIVQWFRKQRQQLRPSYQTQKPAITLTVRRARVEDRHAADSRGGIGVGSEAKCEASAERLGDEIKGFGVSFGQKGIGKRAEIGYHLSPRGLVVRGEVHWPEGRRKAIASA